MNLFYILSIHTVKGGCSMSLSYGGMFMFSWVMKLFQPAEADLLLVGREFFSLIVR